MSLPRKQNSNNHGVDGHILKKSSTDERGYSDVCMRIRISQLAIRLNNDVFFIDSYLQDT
jgi:hypothetical protein